MRRAVSLYMRLRWKVPLSRQQSRVQPGELLGVHCSTSFEAFHLFATSVFFLGGGSVTG